MSRSFHTTRRDVSEEESRSYSNEEERAKSVRRLKDNLEKKRRVKRHIRYERKASFPEAHVTPIETIPFEICDASEYLHYPASADDIRGLLNLMPSGIVDGLSKVSFCLGAERQSPSDYPWVQDPEKDPYLGRIGYEALPGIYMGRCLGTYYPAKAEIRLHGYVYASEIANRSMWDLYLRLHMLMTFVHEVGHHYDFTFRIGRGRWRGDSRDNVEIYAESMQHKWLNEYVIPFLGEKYLEECSTLNSWIRHHVGVEIPLALIAGDPRSTGKNGSIRISSFFDTAEAFQEFVRKIHDSCDLMEARLEFANDLHMADKYGLALEIIELVLRSEPRHLKAITLKADICVHLQNYDEAIKVAEHVLSIDHSYVDAYLVLSDSYEGLEEWQRVIEISDTLIGLVSDVKSWHYGSALCSKASALMEKGSLQEAEEIIVTLESQGKRTARLAKRLREKLESCTS